MDSTYKSIDCRWLLALYAIIPLTWAIVGLDVLALDYALVENYLPSTPYQWAFWTVIFGLPHIIASLLTMADREYLGHYRKTLLWPVLAFAAIGTAGHFGPQPMGQNLLFVFVGFYTIYHVLAQQLGLTLMMMSVPPSRTFKAWKWCAIFAGFALYTVVFGGPRLGNYWLGNYSIYEVLVALSGVLCAVLIVLSARLAGESRTAIGTWYLWANTALMASALVVMELGYILFVILMPRIIHDVTAYMVYITHDSNRNREQTHNIIYRLTPFVRVPPLIMLPVLSVGIAWLMTLHESWAPISIAIVTVSLLHYYFEGFIWRGPNPHRANVEFRR